MPEKPLAYYQRRNDEIQKLFASGYKTAEIANHYELSVDRVRQILRWSGARKRKPTPKTPRQIMLGLGLDADLVQLELLRVKSKF